MARAFKSRGSSAFALAHAEALTGVAATAPFLGEAKFKHSFEIDLSKLVPDPQQPRRFFDEEALNELASSLDLHGQLQPILVRPADDDRGWIIVVGERRWRAASQLGWEKMLAIEFTGDRRSAMLVENIIRADLSPVEEAEGLQQLMKEQGWSQREAAAKLGISQPRINRALRILTLPTSFLIEAAAVGIAPNILVGIARENDPARQQTLMQRALAGNLTVALLNQTRSVTNAGGQQGSDGKVGSAAKQGGSRGCTVAKKAMTALLVDQQQGLTLSNVERKILTELRSVLDDLLQS